MTKKNIEIRKLLFENGIKHYQFAEKLNISEWTLYRRLRQELSSKEKIKYIQVINEMIKEES